MKLLLVDGIGPFFRPCRRHRINWSKIPFDSVEKGDSIDQDVFPQIRRDFRTVVSKSREMGFNGITLDNVAHLAALPDYPNGLKQLIQSYREAFGELFDIAVEHDMGVYLTTDIMFYPVGAPDDGKPDIHKVVDALRLLLTDIFESFPQVRGIIFRIGECDGKDVEGRFRSKLVITQPSQARAIIQGLLPLFEEHERLFIFRTWTVGAYKIGDLIWNRTTFDAVFEGIDSPYLVISFKYGETDFFRFLPLNKLFFRSRHKKIIEFQARREYEGSGQYPAFTGWYYEHFVRQLAGNENVIGAWIWIQSGGWSVFRRLTFLDDSAIWNEINAYVTLRLVADGISTEQAIKEFATTRLDQDDGQKLVLLLRLSSEVVEELLYLDQLARQKLFFRRVRIPPLLSVFWDQIIVNHSMRKLMRCLVTDGEEAIYQGYAALRKIRMMQPLAAALGLPERDIAFQHDTFEILAVAREYYFGDFNPSIAERLQSLRQVYANTYRTHYSVRLDFSPFPFSRRSMRRLLSLWVRGKRGYRHIDRILMIRMLSWFSPIFLMARHKTNADLVENRAMGIETVLK